MSETLVERMARAIDQAEIDWCAVNNTRSVADMSCNIKALAALRAIREPTTQMIFDGHHMAETVLAQRIDTPFADAMFMAMVDAAIAEAGGHEPQA